MRLNRHSSLEGRHAFLSPSSVSWMNYDLDKLTARFRTMEAAKRGVELHEYARMAVRLRQKAPEAPTTINMYINDAIGFRMTPEQPLYYSDNCFGTADTLSFRQNLLRIHDLKTGINETSMMQLKGYAAIFCLEYRVKPFDIETILRIYQNDDIKEEQVDPTEILQIMGTIVEFDKHLNVLRAEES